MVEKLREQIVDLEDVISTLRKEYESLQVEQQRIQAENDSAKDEVSILTLAILWCVLSAIVNFLSKLQENIVLRSY